VESELINESFDLINVDELVRSIQRGEGNPDCFRKSHGSCNKKDCFLRQWCLIDETESEKKGGQP